MGPTPYPSRAWAEHPPENILKQRFLRLVVDGIEKGGGGEFDDDLMVKTLHPKPFTLHPTP